MIRPRLFVLASCLLVALPLCAFSNNSGNTASHSQSSLFVSNDGSVDREIRFYSFAGPGVTYVTANKVVTSLGRSSEGDMLVFSLQDNMHATVAGEGTATGKQSRPAFPEVRMSQAYPGIDILFAGAGPQLRYQIEIMREADPTRLRFKVDGATSMKVDRDGSLLIVTPSGELRWGRPVGVQEYLNKPAARIACGYVVDGDEVGFSIGEFDHNGLLTITPQSR